MWTFVRLLVIPRLELRDGIGNNLSSMQSAYADLKLAQKIVGKVDGIKEGGKEVQAKDGVITPEEAARAGKVYDIKTDIQKLTDSFTASPDKQKSPELQIANQILQDLKAGKPITADQIKSLQDVAASLEQKLKQALNADVSLFSSESNSTVREKDIKMLDDAVQSKPYLNQIVNDSKLLEHTVTYPAKPGTEDRMQVLQAYLQGLPPDQANGVRSELSYELAMLKQKDSCNQTIADLKTKLKDPSLTDADKTKIKKDIILNDPDATMKSKITALKGLGMDEKGIVRALQDHQETIATSISAESLKLFKQMGGTGIPPSSVILASGAGEATPGIQGKSNNCIGLFQYSDSAIKSIVKETLGEMENTKLGKKVPRNYTPEMQNNKQPFVIQDKTKETTIHLSASGAETEAFTMDSGVTSGGSYKPSTLKIECGGKLVEFKVQTVAGTGANYITPVTSPLPDGWKYDAKTMSLTVPPGASVLSIEQSSGRTKTGDGLDFIQTNISISNAKPMDTRVDLGSNFDPGEFKMKTLTPETDAKLSQMATYITGTNGPGAKFTVDARSYGPLDAEQFKAGNLVKTKQIDGYAASGPNTQANLESVRLSTLDFDPNSKTISIDSGCDPVKWAMKKHQDIAPQVDKLVDQYKDAKPPMTRNDVLGGLRAFAMLEALQKKIGGSPDVLKNADVVIGTDKAGQQIKMSYEQYNSFANPKKT